MIYPNTQPSGVAGGQDDNRKKLQQMLSHGGAAPMFGGVGRSADASTLGSVGAPALSFNPFLKMLAGHPGETLDNLPANNPLSGFVGSSIPTAGAASGTPPGTVPAPNGGFVPPPQGTNPFDSGGSAAGTATATSGTGGHFNGTMQPVSATSGQITDVNPFFHTLLQLAMYGLDQ